MNNAPALDVSDIPIPGRVFGLRLLCQRSWEAARLCALDLTIKVNIASAAGWYLEHAKGNLTVAILAANAQLEAHQDDAWTRGVLGMLLRIAEEERA